MLRPSRPMIRPFMSSEGSSTTVTVVSAVWLAATRCSASATRFRARRFDSARASSSSVRTRRASSCRTCSSPRSSSSARASACVSPATCSSSASWECFDSLSSSWSWRMCSSRSARPWSRRASSSSFPSISISFARTRSSIFSTCARRSVSSASISLRKRTACSRASTCASRRTASLSRRASSRSWSRIRRAFVTPVVPKTETARSARAAPTAIPIAIPIPICTLSAPRSGIQPPLAAHPTRRRAYAAAIREKPYLRRVGTYRKAAALPRARPPSLRV